MANNKYLPVVGKTYHFYDDGKMSLSRHELVTIEEVIPFNDLPIEKQEYITKAVKDASWLNLYVENIDYVVYGRTNLELDEPINIYPFIRKKCKEGDLWFGIADCRERVHQWSCEGTLDVGGRLTKELISIYVRDLNISVKNDNHEPAVKLLEMIIDYNIKNWDQWVWIEASGKIEEIYKEHNGFNVPSEYAFLYLRNIPFEIVDEYHYKRTISNNTEIKTIFGFKDVKTYEKINSEINDNIKKPIFRDNNEINENQQDKRTRIYNEYIAEVGEQERYKDVIDYFVYLKDDAGFNEFPIESRNILIDAMNKLKEYISNNQDKNNRILLMALEEGQRVLDTTTILEPLKLAM